MGSNCVVMVPLAFDEHFSLLERVEDLANEQLVSELCYDTSMRRQTSPTVWPWDRRTLASRRWLMICSTLNRFLDICLLPFSQDPDARNL